MYDVIERTDSSFLSARRAASPGPWLRASVYTEDAVDAWLRQPGLDHAQPARAALALRQGADFLLRRQGADARFEALEPGALAALWVREQPRLLPHGYAVLRAFFCFMVERERMEYRRGLFLSCYFQALQELHCGA
jgi:hypothetical protein